jgi:tetratricopeptide (TPR) repeat protein
MHPHPRSISARRRRFTGLFASLCTTAILACAQADLAALQAAFAAQDWASTKQIAQSLTQGDHAAEAWKYLSLVALQEADSKAAAAFIDKATDADPHRADLFILRASTYATRVNEVGMLRKLGVAKQIRESFEQALALDPESVPAIMGLYEFYRQAPAIAGGGKDKAATMLEKLATVRPALAQLRLANEAINEKDYASARAALQKGLEAAPGDPALSYQTGRLAALSGEHLEAGRAALEAYLAVPVEPGADLPNHAAALWRLGQIHVQLGDPTTGRDCFEKALTLDPEMESYVRPDLEKL